MIRIGLVGQPNCGKSTLFNMLTGARQHVANYPGVTVDVKRGAFKLDGETYQVIDLPGVYSMTSYSLEETVTRDSVLSGEADFVVNVLDSSNLKQGLYLTVQLIEMGVPLILALNMADVAEGRGLKIDAGKLSELLGVPAVRTVGNKLRGKAELLEAIKAKSWKKSDMKPLDYGDLSEAVEELTKAIEGVSGLAFPPLWGAVKLLENDSQVEDILKATPAGPGILEAAEKHKKKFFEEIGDTSAAEVGLRRHTAVSAVLNQIQSKSRIGPSMTDRADRIVVHRVFGPIILLGVFYLLYYLSINRGYKLTEYFGPVLRRIELYATMILPKGGLLTDGLLRDLGMSVVIALNAVLNYVPIFLVLFACIAVLEDLGYMPRIAFILDRALRRFGLQGQSTLPLILGGVFVGGCAVPGVMATRVIADEKARLATILVVPMMNCLAKVPLYSLLIGAFFADISASMMVFISTITLFMALCAAKVLTMTVLKNKPSAPFIMELPPYHIPTLRGVVLRSVERTLIFVKKIGTIVAAVTVGIFFLTRFPGAQEDVVQSCQADVNKAAQDFRSAIADTRFAPLVATDEGMEELIDAMDRTKRAIFAGVAKSNLVNYLPSSTHFADLYDVSKSKDPDVRKVNKEWRAFLAARGRARKRLSDDVLNRSVLGRIGQFLEPVTKYAGFNWKVNVSLLSALAAKESTVATLGLLYKPADESPNGSIAHGLQSEDGYTPLHALALMIFMALYPPCLATLVMVKVEAGSWRWVGLSLLFPTVLGLLFGSLIFSGGRALGLNGPQMVIVFSVFVAICTVVLGMIKPKNQLLELRKDSPEPAAGD